MLAHIFAPSGCTWTSCSSIHEDCQLQMMWSCTRNVADVLSVHDNQALLRVLFCWKGLKYGWTMCRQMVESLANYLCVTILWYLWLLSYKSALWKEENSITNRDYNILKVYCDYIIVLSTFGILPIIWNVMKIDNNRKLIYLFLPNQSTFTKNNLCLCLSSL